MAIAICPDFFDSDTKYCDAQLLDLQMLPPDDTIVAFFFQLSLFLVRVFSILEPSWIDTVWGFFFPTKPFPAGCWDWPGAGIPPKKAEFVRNDNPEQG